MIQDSDYKSCSWMFDVLWLHADKKLGSNLHKCRKRRLNLCRGMNLESVLNIGTNLLLKENREIPKSNAQKTQKSGYSFLVFLKMHIDYCNDHVLI